MNNKGSLSYFVVFLIVAIMGMLVYAMLVPMAQRFNIEVYSASEQQLLDANATAATLQHTGVRENVQGIFQNEVDNVGTNQEILSITFIYSGIIILITIAIVLFLLARRNVEAGRGLTV